VGLSTPLRSYEATGAESGNLRDSALSACYLDTWALGLSKRGLGLGPWPLEKTSETALGLGPGTLGTQGKWLGLGSGTLGLSLVSNEFGVGAIHESPLQN
jgi:hypothetical protein